MLLILFLEREGYTVLKVRNGQDAINQARAFQGAIDLALLDVVMPLIGGREAMEEISRINPSIRFLFTSGHSQDGAQSHFVLGEGQPLIVKPYPGEMLLQKIREVLDRE